MYSEFEKLLDLHSVRAADVARATGLSYSTLSDWKHGRYVPKVDKLQKIADYFEVDVGRFIRRDP